jgi:hypothetical protein
LPGLRVALFARLQPGQRHGQALPTWRTKEEKGSSP